MTGCVCIIYDFLWMVCFLILVACVVVYCGCPWGVDIFPGVCEFPFS